MICIVSDTCMANGPIMRGNPTAHRTHPSLPSSQVLAPCARQPGFRARLHPSFRSKVYKPFFSLQNLRCTSQDMRSEKHCTSPSFLRTTHESESVRQPGQTTTSIESTKVKNPILCYTSYNTISPSYTPLPGVMTALALRTSLILVVEFHAVCRCTICGAVKMSTRTVIVIPGMRASPRGRC